MEVEADEQKRNQKKVARDHFRLSFCLSQPAAYHIAASRQLSEGSAASPLTSTHLEMPKAPVTKSKPQASTPGRKGANKKNGAAKKPVGKPRVQVSFESGAAGAKASQLKKEDVKGKGRAEDTELVESGDEDVTMTESNVKMDDEEDTKPDISKLNGEAPKKRKTDATRNEKFLVIAGSYEKNMYGLEIDVKDYRSSDPETAPPIVKPIFIFPAHLSCIKTVAASPEGGKFLASGSDDEFVKVWDLRRRKEIGSLSQHVGESSPLCRQDVGAQHFCHDRIYHLSRLPYAVALARRVRGLHHLPLPYKGLGPAAVAQGSFWTHQLHRRSSVWQGRT